jgi:hypothetical protein
MQLRKRTRNEKAQAADNAKRDMDKKEEQRKEGEEGTKAEKVPKTKKRRVGTRKNRAAKQTEENGEEQKNNDENDKSAESETVSAAPSKQKEDWRKVGFLGRGLGCYESELCYIGMLPEETLLRIFQFLDLVSLSLSSMVCTAWFNLCFDKTMRRILDFTALDPAVGSRTRSVHLKRILTHCPHLTVIDLRRVAQVTDATVKVIVTYCKELQHLNLWNSQLLTDCSMHYLTKLSQLQSLDIASCIKMTAPKINETLICLTNLQSLNLSGLSGTFHLGHLTKLKRLELESGPKCDLARLCDCLQELRLLNVRRCELLTPYWSAQRSAEAVTAQILSLPKLKALYAEHFAWINSGRFDDVIRNLIVAKQRQQLRTADQKNTDHAEGGLGQHGTAPTNGYINSTSSTSFNSPADLTIDDSSLESSKLKLQLLYLDRTTLTSTQLITFTKLLGGLQYLSLQYVRGVNDEFVAELAHRCPLLEELYITGCLNITSASLNALSDEAHKLFILSIGDVPAFAADLPGGNLGWRTPSTTDVVLPVQWSAQQLANFQTALLLLVASKPHLILTYCETHLNALERIQELKPTCSTMATTNHIMREGRNWRRHFSSDWYARRRFNMRRSAKVDVTVPPKHMLTIKW